MDTLFQIIQSLKKEEVRAFKIFSQRYALGQEAKVIALFDKIRSGKYDEAENALVPELFPESPANANAYYRLKNRLKTEVEKTLLGLHFDLDERIALMNLLNLANIFNYKSLYGLSVRFLQKAEKMAEKNELYDILDTIYNELINLSHNFADIDPIEYIEKRKANLPRKELAIETDHAIAAISYRLKQTTFFRQPGDVQEKLQNILRELNIAGEIYQTPRVKLRIHLSIRDILLHQQDFQALENYLIESLRDFEADNLFTKSSQPSKINLITWIINALIINRKFDKALHYAELLPEELNKFNRLYYDRFIWTYYQSLIPIYMFSNRLTEAIETLEEIRETALAKSNLFYDYAIHVNLSLCFFYRHELSKSIQSLSYLLTKDIFPRLSPEYQLAVSIVECILHYERDNLDYVEYKINEARRQYRALLKRPEYEEDNLFLRLLYLLSTRPSPMSDKAVQTQLKKFMEKAAPLQVGSSKHIDYYIWLQSKLQKRPHYDILLESLGQKPAPTASAS